MPPHAIIPIGDHCAAAICLQEAGLRQCAFPFDWVVTSLPDKQTHSNLAWVVDTIAHLLHHDVEPFVASLFGPDQFDAATKTNTHHNIWFPHDAFNGNRMEETQAKYVRRFARLVQTLRSGSPVTCLFITRSNINPNLLRALQAAIEVVNPHVDYVCITGKDTNLHLLKTTITQISLHAHSVDAHANNVARRPAIVQFLLHHFAK